MRQRLSMEYHEDALGEPPQHTSRTSEHNSTLVHARSVEMGHLCRRILPEWNNENLGWRVFIPSSFLYSAEGVWSVWEGEGLDRAAEALEEGC